MPCKRTWSRETVGGHVGTHRPTLGRTAPQHVASQVLCMHARGAACTCSLPMMRVASCNAALLPMHASRENLLTSAHGRLWWRLQCRCWRRRYEGLRPRAAGRLLVLLPRRWCTGMASSSALVGLCSQDEKQREHSYVRSHGMASQNQGGQLPPHPGGMVAHGSSIRPHTQCAVPHVWRRLNSLARLHTTAKA